ncbi:MAG: hypothetical protein LGB54_02460 [Sulfurovum sp.]|nr:hypothetical protein [Sulfurovum sp.]
MGIFDLFSKRQKKLRGDMPDIYQYADINKIFRVQVVHIMRDTFGKDSYKNMASGVFHFIHKSLCKEYGVFTLTEYTQNDAEAIYDFFLSTNDYEKALDIIEFSFKVINTIVRKNTYQSQCTEIVQNPDDAIDELNKRFKEHGIGYQFESNKLIRVDSQIIHSEIVKPVLVMLHDKIYSGANEEFLKAHEHYRSGRYPECLNECLKSFESTLKTICDNNKWVYTQNDTANKLIKICFENKLIPEYMQTQFTSLQSLFSSGIPTIRNKNSGHGQGVNQNNVTQEMTNYMLNLTATNILFLVQQNKSINQ